MVSPIKSRLKVTGAYNKKRVSIISTLVFDENFRGNDYDRNPCPLFGWNVKRISGVKKEAHLAVFVQAEIGFYSSLKT